MLNCGTEIVNVSCWQLFVLYNEEKNTTLSEQFQNAIEKWQKETQSIPITHKYMTTHFPDENFKLFRFPIFRFWAYLMKVIAETRRVH